MGSLTRRPRHFGIPETRYICYIRYRCSPTRPSLRRSRRPGCSSYADARRRCAAQPTPTPHRTLTAPHPHRTALSRHRTLTARTPHHTLTAHHPHHTLIAPPLHSAGRGTPRHPDLGGRGCDADERQACSGRHRERHHAGEVTASLLSPHLSRPSSSYMRYMRYLRGTQYTRDTRPHVTRVTHVTHVPSLGSRRSGSS